MSVNYNSMSQITITEKISNEKNLLYVQTGLAEILSNTDCKISSIHTSDRAKISIQCPEVYYQVIKMEILDMVSEIITVGYKYEFLKKEVKVSGLNESEKEILLTSLIAADFYDDKKWTLERYKDSEEISIDGVYNFRLEPLKKKWREVASYMPKVFLSEQLKDFIAYLIENKKKRAFVDDGRVYDHRYKRLKRCNLIEYKSLRTVREVLLSNCGEVELSGKIPEEDERYLKEFYGDKIIFSKDN